MVDYNAVLSDLIERRTELDAAMRAIGRIVGETTGSADARFEQNARESVTSAVPNGAAMQQTAAGTPTPIPMTTLTPRTTAGIAPGVSMVPSTPTVPEQSAATQSRSSFLNGVSLRSAAHDARKAQTATTHRMPHADGLDI